MRKIIISICFFILYLSLAPCNYAMAESEQIYYAKIQSTGVNLCSSPSENSVLFELPYSYFVKVNYIVDDYFKVTYKDVEGYVKKDKVKLMNGTPQNPYANATFKLFVPYKLYEFSSQTSTPKVELNDTNISLTYYGTKAGQQVTSTSNIWYYSSIIINDQTYHGYVFSGVTDFLTNIATNTESFDIVSDEILTSSSSEFRSLSTGTKIMLVVAISVPSVLILYFLVKPSKIMQVTKAKKQVKKENRKIKHGDYFEFDENEL